MHAVNNQKWLITFQSIGAIFRKSKLIL